VYLSGVKPGTVTVLRAGARPTHRTLRRLWPGDPQWPIAPIGRALVVFGGDATYAYDQRLHQPPRRLGASSYFIPSTRPGHVWLIGARQRSAREVDMGGRITPPRGRLPRGWPSAAVDSGLVVQRIRHLVLWNSHTGAVEHRLPGIFPVATHGSLVASCAYGCPVLHLTDTATGAAERVPGGPGWRFEEGYDGAFSADGALLAAPVRTSAGPVRIAVVEVRTGRATLMPGRVRDYPQMAWSTAGWLFFSASERRVGAYLPGQARATLLPDGVAPFTHLAAR
jgi:hypothetical protein